MEENVINETTETDGTEETKEEKSSEKPQKDKKEVKKLREENEALNKSLEELNDRYLRTLAEYDNFRQRAQKEKEGVYADAYSDCIAGILPILDNLERAAAFDQLEGLKKGLEMTAKAFEEALEKMGITEIETKVFDPNLHNAVMHVEDEAFGESEIVEVFQKGYCKGDKVIRYAMVKVAN